MNWIELNSHEHKCGTNMWLFGFPMQHIQNRKYTRKSPGAFTHVEHLFLQRKKHIWQSYYKYTAVYRVKFILCQLSVEFVHDRTELCSKFGFVNCLFVLKKCEFLMSILFYFLLFWMLNKIRKTYEIGKNSKMNYYIFLLKSTTNQKIIIQRICPFKFRILFECIFPSKASNEIEFQSMYQMATLRMCLIIKSHLIVQSKSKTFFSE